MATALASPRTLPGAALVQWLRLCLLGALFFTACVPAQIATPTQPAPTATAPPPTAPSSPPTATPGPEALVGTYTVTFTQDELAQAGVTAHELCENAGTHEITFQRETWTWQQTPPAECSSIVHPEGKGTWQALGDQITLNEPAAFGCGAIATYAWKLEGGTLSFVVVQDGCPYRVILLTTHPWTKVQ